MLRVALDTHLGSFQLSLSFLAESAKTTVLLGESGAGKSSTLRFIAGLLSPEHGHISLDGVTYFDREQGIIVPPQQRPFGYVFQDYLLFPHLTVFENVAFGLRAQHLPRSVVRQRVTASLEQMHVSGLEQRRPAQLSGGQQQRVAIARALTLRPKLLLLDEPLAALDIQTRRQIRQELRRLLSDIGTTTLMVTHNYLEALLFGHSILVLDQGRLIQQGEQRDLLAYPRSSYVAELIGVNFFRGQVISIETSSITVRLQNGQHIIEIVATLKDAAEHHPVVGEEAYVVINPRTITLHTQSPTSSARNLFQGEIVQMIPLGTSFGESNEDRIRTSIALDGTSSLLTAEISIASVHRLELQEGRRVYATFKATEAHAYV